MTIDIGAPSGVDPLLELFAQCVVRVDVDGSFAGSGFYIAPGEVLTCAHVVHGGKAITVGEGWAANPTTQLLPPATPRPSSTRNRTRCCCTSLTPRPVTPASAWQTSDQLPTTSCSSGPG